MIGRIKGKLVKKLEHKIFIDVSDICYEVNIPKAISLKLDNDLGESVEFIIYNYLHMEKSRGIPVMIGFLDELEREFFEIFISVSGIGPKAALKAFDKPISSIAKAIEEGDIVFLKGLAGIGMQKAKQIVAQLQGKVGRFALIKGEEQEAEPIKNREIVHDAKQILKRLQYSTKEIDSMIKKALEAKPQIESVESLLNEIYRRTH